MESERSTNAPITTIGGIPVYVKDTLPPRTVEIRDRYGILMATINNAGSVALSVKEAR